MLKNYLVVAVRQLLAHKTFTAINIAGLALGAGWLCIARVPPGMIGVRQKNFGDGIVPEDHVRVIPENDPQEIRRTGQACVTSPDW